VDLEQTEMAARPYQVFWYSMSHAKLCDGVVILSESLAWKS